MMKLTACLRNTIQHRMGGNCRNTAQWARIIRVEAGLLKKDSPHGIWEISEQGRAELQKRTIQ